MPGPAQRDQIWRNFATFAKKSKFLKSFHSLFLIWHNVEPTLEHRAHYWAHFHCC